MSKSLSDNGLTIETQAFADAYNGNIEEAATIAGISYGYARSLLMSLTSPNIEPMAIKVQESIKNRQAKAKNKVIATRERRQALWTEFLEDCNLTPFERLKASELLGKSEGDFLDVHVDVSPQSLADIAAITSGRKAISNRELKKLNEGNEDESV